MADDETKPAPVAEPKPQPRLTVRSYRVVPDLYNKSPNGIETEIVEVEFLPAGEGNHVRWMQWNDLGRFRCERGKAEACLRDLDLMPVE